MVFWSCGSMVPLQGGQSMLPELDYNEKTPYDSLTFEFAPVPAVLPTKCLTTIHDLPYEIILRILELGIEDLDEKPLSEGRSQQDRDRLKFLLSTSLVCSHMTSPSHSLLWRKIYLDREEGVQLVLKNPGFGQFTTQKVVLCGTKKNASGVSSESALELMRGLNGVQQLNLRNFVELKQDVFNTRALYSLKTVTLREVSVRLNSPLPPPSFSLHTLSVDHFCSAHEHDVYQVFGSSLSSLTSLRATGHMAPKQIAYFRSFLESTSTIKTVSFVNLIPVTLMIGKLIPAFSNFSTLEHLSITCTGAQLEETVKLLPDSSSITLLSLSLPLQFYAQQLEVAMEELLRGLLRVADHPTLQGLKTLMLRGRGTWFQDGNGGKDLRAKLECRGVQILLFPS